MKFIDINSLPKKLRGANTKNLYVDLSSITVVSVALKEEGWTVAMTTSIGFIGLICEDEKEADKIALKLVNMIEEVRILPLKTHVGTASDMMDKLSNIT